MWVRHQKSSLFLFPRLVCHSSLTVRSRHNPLSRGAFPTQDEGSSCQPLRTREWLCVSSGVCLFSACILYAPVYFQLNWKRRAGKPSFMWIKGKLLFFSLVSSEHLKIRLWIVEIGCACEREELPGGYTHGVKREEPGMFPIGLFCMLNHLRSIWVLERNTLLLGIPTCH